MDSSPVLEINESGDNVYRLNGRLHRTDGPAIDYANGDKFWYLNGDLHRTDGPAIDYAHGSKFWYLNGKYHRTDGPAVEYPDGYMRWCLNGNEYSFEEWLELTPLSEKEKVKLRLQYASNKIL